MARGVDGRLIFIDSEDRERFLRLLFSVAEKSNAVIIAFCLMPNHFHLAIKNDGVPLSVVMQRVLTSYSQAFNSKHRRAGHLFQARYKSIHCLDEAYLLSLIRYIHENPVRAKMVSRAAEWPWSSVSLRSRLSAEVSGYWHARADDMEIEPSFDPWPKRTPEASLLRSEPGGRRNSLREIALRVAQDEGRLQILLSTTRRRDVIRERRLVADAAIREGYSLIEVARYFGVSQNSAGRYLKNTADNVRPDT